MAPTARASVTSDPDGPTTGWVLYDGGCGFCSRWLTFWAPTLNRLGLAIVPLQAAWVAERLGMDEATLLRDIRLLFTDGRQLAGADVYRWVVGRLWWAQPLYLFAIAPGGRRLFDFGYRAFRDNRVHVSAACRLPPAPGGGRIG